MKNDNNQAISETTIEAMIQKMTLVFFAIIAGIIVFAGVAFYLVTIAGKEVSTQLDETFKIVVPLLAVAGAFASRFIYSFLVKKAAAQKDAQRISHYQTATLVRLAILEGPCLFTIVAYLLIGNNFYLIILAALLLLMVLLKPNKFRYQEEMETYSRSEL